MKDVSDFLREFQDYLAPTLDTYEQAIYLYCIRHSRLLGVEECVIGFKSARKNMAFGIGKAGTSMSEGVVYEKIRSLEQKGCLTNLGSERQGTRLRVALPSEIDGIITQEIESLEPSLEDVDFFSPENRARIMEREDYECFYCRRKIDDQTYVIEHVVSRPEGNNSYRNLVASCRRCNNRKSDASAEDFFRLLYREGLLTEDDFGDGLTKLQALVDGTLKPSAA